MRKPMSIVFAGILLISTIAEAGKFKHAGNASLDVSYIGMKYKGSWTLVAIALENKGDKDAKFECCKVYLENDAGFSVAQLTQGEMDAIIHNKAGTAAAIGALVGLGLGIGGAISGNTDLQYAGLGVGLAGTAAGTIGEAAAGKQRRDLVIDDIMRNTMFPSGLKIAGSVFFPPKKKWQGSNKPKALHVIYAYKGSQEHVVLPINN